LSFLGMSFLALRRLLLARIGGTTGDTLGATCELSETTALLVLTLLLPHPA
jgi:adenosylcobinamide-GDP ribazoletransferase